MARQMNFPEDWSGFGPKMQALKERERKFIWAYLTNALLDGKENGAQSARDAGYSDVKEGAKVRAHTLMHRPDILDAMQEVAANELRGLAIPAVVAMAKIIQNEKHVDHRRAVESVLDRIGHGARAQIDVNVNGTVQVNHTEAAIEDLRRLKALGVPREKLLETFGYSGLDRYETLLLEADRRAGKVIDGEVVKDG